MEEIVEGEAQRAASVFEDRGSATTAQAADVLAVTATPDETARSDGDDEEFDVVDAIMEAPAEFVADPEVADAFASILQSNGFEASEIEEILNQQQQAGVEAQSGIQEEGGEFDVVPTATTTTDAGSENAESIADEENDTINTGVEDVDAELLENAEQDVGVEAQSGEADAADSGETDEAGDVAADNACPAMTASGDDATADSDTTTTDVADADTGDADDAGADTTMGMDDPVTDTDDAADTTEVAADVDMGGCDLDSIDWFTPGENGISKLGEVVQAFQMLVEMTGDKMPIMPAMDFCTPTPPCMMDEMLNDMANNGADDADMAITGTDDDMG